MLVLGDTIHSIKMQSCSPSTSILELSLPSCYILAPACAAEVAANSPKCAEPQLRWVRRSRLVRPVAGIQFHSPTESHLALGTIFAHPKLTVFLKSKSRNVGRAMFDHNHFSPTSKPWSVG